MSYSNAGYQPSAARFPPPSNMARAPQPVASADFDILDWHPAYESCQRYFLDHAQHEPGTQALCALINIRLPFQWSSNPLPSFSAATQSTNGQSAFVPGQWPRPSPSPTPRASSQSSPAFVSLVPYVRRLVVTGFDRPGILHGFFGDAFQTGIAPLQECERRNYLFAAKHGGWRSCKRQYDMNADETVPFLKPLQNVGAEELQGAEASWSSWLAMEDWEIEPATEGYRGRSTAPATWAHNPDEHMAPGNPES